MGGCWRALVEVGGVGARGGREYDRPGRSGKNTRYSPESPASSPSGRDERTVGVEGHGRGTGPPEAVSALVRAVPAGSGQV